MSTNNEIFWEAMASNMPQTFPRKRVEELTGGLLTAKVMANLDSKQIGPMVKVRIGKHIMYERDSFIRWLQLRSQKG